MKDQFFYKTKGRVHGPVKFDVLVSQLRKGELSLTDSVRTQGSNDWQRVDYLMKSLVDQFPEISSVTNAQKTTRPKGGTAPARVSRSRGGGGLPGAGVLGGLFGLVGKGIEEVVLFVANFFEVLLSGFGRKQAVVLMLIVGWIGLNFGYYLYSSAASYEREIANYQALGSVWQEFRQLRDSEATAEQWSQFQADVEPKIDAIVSELERDATTDSPINMQLLWVSRDFLPQMLVDAREEPSHSETLFSAHMQQAARLLARAGQPVKEF